VDQFGIAFDLANGTTAQIYNDIGSFPDGMPPEDVIQPSTLCLGCVNVLTSFTVTQTPLPAALPLFATGLGALGLLGWHRKRKAQAVA